MYNTLFLQDIYDFSSPIQQTIAFVNSMFSYTCVMLQI